MFPHITSQMVWWDDCDDYPFSISSLISPLHISNYNNKIFPNQRLGITPPNELNIRNCPVKKSWH